MTTASTEKQFLALAVSNGVNIEEQWKGRNGKTHFRIVGATSGKFQESVL